LANRRNRGRDVSGILLLDKGMGLTSNACLQQVKRLYAAAKAGHTGSLDPLATGVLPLCLGEATKISQFLLDADKRYQVTGKLGVVTDTADAEGNIVSESPVPQISTDTIEKLLTQFIGELEQVPPMYSALKHQGTPLYKLARQGKEVERKARRVTVFSLELLAFSGDSFTLDVHCSKGTYVRTLVDDIGRTLGCGAHVTALRRTQAGSFTEHACVTIERLLETKESGGLEALDALLVPMEAAVESLPEVRLPSVTARFVKQGQAVIVRHLPAEGLVRLYDEEQFFGIGAILDDGRVAPRRLIQGEH